MMKYGVCRGAKPLCKESEGFPQISSPFLARKGVRGWSTEFLKTLLVGWVPKVGGKQIGDPVLDGVGPVAIFALEGPAHDLGPLLFIHREDEGPLAGGAPQNIHQVSSHVTPFKVC